MLQRIVLAALVLLAVPSTASFNLSNTLGDGMVLQRAPKAAIVWDDGTEPTMHVTAVAKKTLEKITSPRRPLSFRKLFRSIFPG